MFKKSIFTLFCLVLMFSIVIGCTGGPNVEKEANNSEVNQNEGATTDEVVTIKVHSWYSEDEFQTQKVKDAFEAKYPNIKIEYISLSEQSSSLDYTKRLDLAAAGGEDLDVIFLNNAANYSQRVGVGMLEPLEGFLEAENINVKEEYKVDPVYTDGKYYALPGKYMEAYVLLNKDHLKEANLTVPQDWTWDEFMDYSKKLTKGEGATKRYGNFFFPLDQFRRLALSNQAENNDLLKDDGTSNMDNPLLRKTLEIRQKMEFEDQSTTPFATILSQDLHYRPQFMNQETSMIIMFSFMNSELGGTEQFPIDFEVAVAKYPRNAEDKINYAPVGGDLIGMYSKSKNKDAAFKFIRWFSTEGMLEQGMNTSAWVNADLEKELDAILSKANDISVLDKESLLYTLGTSNPAKLFIPPAYKSEVDKAWQEELELFMLGNKDMDTALQNARDKVQRIIDANEK